jgi:hypothetical protein
VAKRSRTRLSQPDSTAPASSRRGSTRRPASRRAHQKTFIERNGSYILIGLVIIGVVGIAYLAFSSVTQEAYT